MFAMTDESDNMSRQSYSKVLAYLAGCLKYSRNRLIQFTDQLEHGVIRQMLQCKVPLQHRQTQAKES